MATRITVRRRQTPESELRVTAIPDAIHPCCPTFNIMRGYIERRFHMMAWELVTDTGTLVLARIHMSRSLCSRVSIQRKSVDKPDETHSLEIIADGARNGCWDRGTLKFPPGILVFGALSVKKVLQVTLQIPKPPTKYEF